MCVRAAELDAALARAVVERAVRAWSPATGSKRLSGRSGSTRLVGLLRVVAVAREVAVDEARRDRVADDRLDRRPADHQLRAAGAAPPRRSPRRRPRAGRSAAPAAGVRGIFARLHVNCGVFSAGSCTIVRRTCEPSCRSSERSDSRKPCSACLRAAVRRLQRDAAVGERRADLDDHAAVARPHAAQRGHRPPDRAEVGDLGRRAGTRPASSRVDRREDGRHRVVDPDVDRAELVLDLVAPPLRPARRRRRRPGPRPRGRRGARPRRAPPRAAPRPRATSPTRRPARANARAVARPTPADAPVTTTTGDSVEATVTALPRRQDLPLVETQEAGLVGADLVRRRRGRSRRLRTPRSSSRCAPGSGPHRSPAPRPARG